jgi:hypothetical protein
VAIFSVDAFFNHFYIELQTLHIPASLRPLDCKDKRHETQPMEVEDHNALKTASDSAESNAAERLAKAEQVRIKWREVVMGQAYQKIKTPRKASLKYVKCALPCARCPRMCVHKDASQSP